METSSERVETGEKRIVEQIKAEHKSKMLEIYRRWMHLRKSVELQTERLQEENASLKIENAQLISTKQRVAELEMQVADQNTYLRNLLAAITGPDGNPVYQYDDFVRTRSLINLAWEELEKRTKVELEVQRLQLAEQNLLLSQKRFEELSNYLEEELEKGAEELETLAKVLQNRNQRLRDVAKGFKKPELPHTSTSVQVKEVKVVNPKKRTLDSGQEREREMKIHKASCSKPNQEVQVSYSASAFGSYSDRE